MDAELRLLLYVVVLGSVVGIGVIVRRRAHALRWHGFQLAAIAAAALLGLFRDDVGAALAWPLFGAWAAVAVLPTLLVQSARRAASVRSYAFAARLTAFSAGLLLLPPTIRREARVYAALDAADRGDEALCRARLEALARDDGRTPSPETSDLLRFLPAAAARRSDELLRAVDASSVRSPLVLAAEASAAAETGDLRRALRAVHELGRMLRQGAPALAQARRSVLAAAGRAAFLDEAIRARLPVASGPPGAAALALARALEASGDLDRAAATYAAAARSVRGVLLRDARDGGERCTGAPPSPRLARLDELETAAVLDLESACRRETADPAARPLVRRAPATLALCLVTTVASVLVFVLYGTDVLSLVGAGALSAPLVRDEGEWWRLASAILLHGGVAHLLLNIASILVIGVPYEQRAGSVRTVIVYVASGLFASAASVYVNGTDVGIGASGAGMGLFGALAAMLVLRRNAFEASERRQWLVSSAIVLGGNAAIGFLEHAAVDNAAHAGGFVAGALLGWLLLPVHLESEVHRGVRRLVAASCLTILAISAGAVVRDLPAWRGSETVEFRGARVTLPAWIRVEDGGTLGAVALRRPLPFGVQFGRRGDAWPDPAALVARVAGEHYGAPVPHRWFGVASPAGEPGAGAGDASGDGADDADRAVVHEFLLRPVAAPGAADGGDDGAPAAGNVPVRAVVVERGGVFAVVVLAGDAEGRAAFGPALDRVRRTLVPLIERSPR